MRRHSSVVGAHISVAGGLATAFARADQVGAEAIQVFTSSPRAWAPPPPDPEGDEAFRDEVRRRKLPVFVHAPYLINFGSPSAETLVASTRTLHRELTRGREIGAQGVVLHAGSAVAGTTWDEAVAQVRAAVLPILDAVPGTPPLLIEPTAGGGGSLASTAASLAAYLHVIGPDERIGVCLDTCHMHAAGHDMSTTAGFTTALAEFSAAAGRGRIQLVHVNDSRDAVGSKRDRHESVGEGTIGRDAFGALFRSHATRAVPKVTETNPSNLAADVATLKDLRASA